VKTPTPLLIGLLGLSGCGLLQTAAGPVQAPNNQHCAKISWHSLGAARDINAAIFAGSGDAGLTRLAYGPGPRRGPQAPSAETAELDQPLRSERSLDLSAEFPREYEKAQIREVEQWLQAHLAVEVRSCPG